MTDVLQPEDLEGFTSVYCVQESDQAGHTFVTDLQSRIRGFQTAGTWSGRLLVVRLPAGIKDSNDLHREDPTQFHERWHEALAAAIPSGDQLPVDAPVAATPLVMKMRPGIVGDRLLEQHSFAAAGNQLYIFTKKADEK